MKVFIKCLCFVLALTTLLPTTAIAEQAEEQVSTYSNFFISYSCYCWKTTDTQFEVWFDVIARDDMDKLGVEKIKIQKSSDGENWMTVMTYNSSYYTQLLIEDDFCHGGCVTYTGAYGYYYRAYITFYAENSSGIGKIFEYTQPIYLGS